ncbi:unnamed protein product [Diamesa serratosioi]
MVKFTIKRFLCLSLKTCSNIAGVCGIVGCSIGGFKIPPLQNTTSERNYQHASTSFAFFYSLSYFVSSVLLVVGAAKCNLKLLIPFLTVHPIVCLILSVAAFVLENIEVFSLAVLVNYSWLCVFSLHKALKIEEKNQLTAQYNSDPPPPYQDFEPYPTSVYISHPPIGTFPTAPVERNAPLI